VYRNVFGNHTTQRQGPTTDQSIRIELEKRPIGSEVFENHCEGISLERFALKQMEGFLAIGRLPLPDWSGFSGVLEADMTLSSVNEVDYLLAAIDERRGIKPVVVFVL